MYIELSAAPAADSVEVAEGVVIDVDARGVPVGIGIDPARGVVDLESIDLRLWSGDKEKPRTPVGQIASGSPRV